MKKFRQMKKVAFKVNLKTKPEVRAYEYSITSFLAACEGKEFKTTREMTICEQYKRLVEQLLIIIRKNLDHAKSAPTIEDDMRAKYNPIIKSLLFKKMSPSMAGYGKFVPAIFQDPKVQLSTCIEKLIAPGTQSVKVEVLFIVRSTGFLTKLLAWKEVAVKALESSGRQFHGECTISEVLKVVSLFRLTQEKPRTKWIYQQIQKKLENFSPQQCDGCLWYRPIQQMKGARKLRVKQLQGETVTADILLGMLIPLPYCLQNYEKADSTNFLSLPHLFSVLEYRFLACFEFAVALKLFIRYKSEIIFEIDAKSSWADRSCQLLISFAVFLGNLELLKDLLQFLEDICGYASHRVRLTPVKISSYFITTWMQSKKENSLQQRKIMNFMFIDSPLATAIVYNHKEIIDYLLSLDSSIKPEDFEDYQQELETAVDRPW